MRQVVLRMETGQATEVPLDTCPNRVWRWSTLNQPDEDVHPIHGVNAQLEDRTHDWNWRDGVFRYSGVGHHSDFVWLVLQYEEEASSSCTECEVLLPSQARFCMYCGHLL